MGVMNKLLRIGVIVCRLIHVRKSFLLPKPSNILIYGGRSEWFDECLEEILYPYSVGKLCSLADEVNVPILLLSFLQRCNVKDAYNDLYIRKVNPKVVITYLDNSEEFYSFSVRNSSIKTLFIQNGVRSYYGDIFSVLDNKELNQRYKVDYMLVFGQCVGIEYAKYISGSVVPIGSFKNNKIPIIKKKQNGTISFVSQYRNIAGIEIDGMYYTFNQFLKQSDNIIVPFLMDYAKEKGLHFKIIPSQQYSEGSKDLENEKNYYNEIVGTECDFIERKRIEDSYESIDAAEVVVAIDTSMGLEAIARGTKTAIFSIRPSTLELADHSDLNYGWPGNYQDNGVFWTNIPDRKIFRRILDHLLDVSHEQWTAEVIEHGFWNLMQIDSGNSKLLEIIENEMNKRVPA